MGIETRPGTVLDAAALKGLVFDAHASGPGPTRVEIPLTDDGRGADDTPRDGVHSGTFVVPAVAHDDIEIVASVHGQGLSGDEQRHTITLDRGSPVAATFRFPNRPTVAPGRSLDGVLAVDNGGEPFSGRISLAEPSRGPAVNPTIVEVARGASETALSIEIPSGTPAGDVTVRVVLSDADGRGLGEGAVTVAVRTPQPSRSGSGPSRSPLSSRSPPWGYSWCTGIAGTPTNGCSTPACSGSTPSCGATGARSAGCPRPAAARSRSRSDPAARRTAARRGSRPARPPLRAL
ncbi:MAG: hypothetical protein ACRD12_03060 [Acidimicrobiales bacterium]